MTQVTKQNIQQAVETQVQNFLGTIALGQLSDDEKQVLLNDMVTDLTTELITGDFANRMNKNVPDRIFETAIKTSLPKDMIAESYGNIMSSKDAATTPAPQKPVYTAHTREKQTVKIQRTPAATQPQPAATKPAATKQTTTPAPAAAQKQTAQDATDNDQPSKSSIMEAQSILTLSGYYNMAIDGAYGPATEAAIIAYAKEYDIRIDSFLEPSGELKNLKGLVEQITESLYDDDVYDMMQNQISKSFEDTNLQPNQNMAIATQRVLNMAAISEDGSAPTKPLDVDGALGSRSRARYKEAFGTDAPATTPLPKVEKQAPIKTTAPAAQQPAPTATQTMSTSEQLQSLVQKSLPTLNSDGTVKFIADSLKADLEYSGIAKDIGIDTLVNAMHTGNMDGISPQILEQANKMLNAYQLAPIEPVKPQATYNSSTTTRTYGAPQTAPAPASATSQSIKADSALVEAMKNEVSEYYSRRGRVPERVRIDDVRYRVPQGHTVNETRDGDFEISWKDGTAFRNDLREQDTVVLALPDGQTTIMGRRDLYDAVDKMDSKSYWRKEFEGASKGQIKKLDGMADDLKEMVQKGERGNLANIFATDSAGSSQSVNHETGQSIVIPVELRDRILLESTGDDLSSSKPSTTQPALN